ncbi:MAG: hypothetical protein J5546_11560 [Lachnospiraceae bacterium]|nr:hypothetical protein [Lachnospiraceae bacterium]
MGYLAVLENIMLALQAVILIPVIVFSAALMKKGENGAFPAFFTFAMISYLLSDIYTILFTIIRPGERMPIAADEIAELSVLLLLIAGIQAISPRGGRKLHVGALIFSILFTSANILLWIAWSGEYVQDIVFGLPYYFLIYLLVREIRACEAMKVKELLAMAAACTVVLILLVLDSFVHDKVPKNALNAIWFAIELGIMEGLVWLALKRLGGEEEKHRKGALYVALSAFIWSVLVSYTNDGMLYVAALGVNTMVLPVVFAVVKRLPADGAKPIADAKSAGDTKPEVDTEADDDTEDKVDAEPDDAK